MLAKQDNHLSEIMLFHLIHTSKEDMKFNHFLLVLAVALSLFFIACGVDNDNTTVRNNLFSQPTDNGDSTCGVRQTLISQKVLLGKDFFYSDILEMWKRIYEHTMTEYPNGIPKETPNVQLTKLFERPLPDIYTEAAVKAAQGGPLAPPSSILNVLEEDGYKIVQYYIDKNALINLFGSGFVNDEVSIFSQVAPEAHMINIDASTSSAVLRSTFNSPESYYMVLVNEGMHWIGLTGTTVYDSLATAPVENTTNFGRRNGDPSETSHNSFTGLVIEIQRITG
jgi:hypothetical protein